MDKVLRLVKNVSIIAFVIVLGLAYMELADKFAPVTLTTDSKGQRLASTDSQTFFYVSAIFFVVLNIMFSLLVRLVKSIPLHWFKIPEKEYWFASLKRQDSLYAVLMSWVYGFALIINVFVTVLVAKIWFVNRGIGGEPYEYGLLALFLVLLLAFWVLFLIYRLKIRREEYIK